MNKPHRKTPRDLLKTLFRRKTLFFLGGALFAIIVLLASHLLPVKYASSATFQRLNDAGSDSDRTKGPGTFDGMKPSLILRLSGPKAIEGVLHDLKLPEYEALPRTRDGKLTEQGLAAQDQIVRALGEAVEVHWDTIGDLVDQITVTAEHSDADLAQQLPEKLIEQFRESVTAESEERLKIASDQLKLSLDKEQEFLNEAVKQRIEFVQKHADMMPETANGLLDKVTKQKGDLETLYHQRDAAQDKLQRMKSMREMAKTTTTLPSSIPANLLASPDQVIKIANPRLAQLRDDLTKAKDALENMIKVQRIKPAHPAYQAMVRKTAQLEQQIKSEPDMVPYQEIYGNTRNNPYDVEIASISSDIETARAGIERGEQDLKNLQKAYDNFLPVRQEYLGLAENEKTLKAHVRDLEKALSNLRAEHQAEITKQRTRFRYVQASQKQYLPSSPKLSMILAAAILGGLAFGGVLVFLANSFDHTIPTSEEAIRYFNLPLHGVVGEIVTGREVAAGRFRRWCVSPMVVSLLLVVIAVASMDVILWLKYPDKFPQWRKAPASFVTQQFSGSMKSQGKL